MSNYRNTYDNYAKSGTTCDTNARELIDNTKFFPLNAKIYKIPFTRMYQYPGYPPSWHEINKNHQNRENEDDKVFSKIVKKSCCGRK